MSEVDIFRKAKAISTVACFIKEIQKNRNFLFAWLMSPLLTSHIVLPALFHGGDRAKKCSIYLVGLLFI